DHLRCRQDRLDENLYSAAANQAAFRHRFIGEIEAHDTRLFLAQHILSCRPYFGFDAAAAHRTHRGTVIADEHFRGLKTRHGSPDLDDGGQRRLTAILPQPLDLVEDINFHKPLSLTYLLTLLAALRRLPYFLCLRPRHRSLSRISLGCWQNMASDRF